MKTKYTKLNKKEVNKFKSRHITTVNVVFFLSCYFPNLAQNP